jgi:hypothetical protein
MQDFMAWLEASRLGHAMRESGIWTYGVVNLFHILGISTLFGSILILDLRLLGAWQSVSLNAIAQPVIPIAAAGFIVATTTGVSLLATKATEYVGNPFLYIKLPAIFLGVINVGILNSLSGWKMRKSGDLSVRQRRHLAIAGGVSLVCWLTAITAGRMIGYW